MSADGIDKADLKKRKVTFAYYRPQWKLEGASGISLLSGREGVAENKKGALRVDCRSGAG